MSLQEYKLMTPGPVPLPEWVLKELAAPVLHHRTDEFEAILQKTLLSLKKLFSTQCHSFVLTATGTGGMEAALVNTLPKGAEVLSIDSGKFGERWHKMAQVLGYRSHHLRGEWGKDIDLEMIRDILSRFPQIKAVLCQACETSTGAKMPVKEIAELTRDHDALCIVDAITGLGAFELPMDEWGLDVVISGSQKALMLPTGLTVLSLSDKAWKQVEIYAPEQAFYWNLIEEKKSNEKTQTRFSSAVSLIRPLQKVLEHFEREGYNNIYKLHQQRADHFRKEVLKNGVSLFPETPSPSLTALNLPAAVDGSKLQKHLQEKYKIVVMGGQDQLKGKILRIGHMGHMSLQDLTETAQAIHQSLKEV